MKRKVIVKFKDKVIEGEQVLRDEDHFKAQLRHPSMVFRNKKKYSRRQKHKEKYDI